MNVCTALDSKDFEPGFFLESSNNKVLISLRKLWYHLGQEFEKFAKYAFQIFSRYTEFLFCNQF